MPNGCVTMPWMTRERHNLSLAWNPQNGVLFASGGLCYPNNNPLDSIEVLNWKMWNLETRSPATWRKATPMFHPRAFHASVCFKNTFIVVGGTGIDGHPLYSAEQYNMPVDGVLNGQWSLIVPLPEAMCRIASLIPNANFLNVFCRAGEVFRMTHAKIQGEENKIGTWSWERQDFLVSLRNIEMVGNFD